MIDKRETLAFGFAGILFGAVVGYVVAYQIHAPRVRGGGSSGAPPPSRMVQRDSPSGEEVMDRIAARLEELQAAAAADPSSPDPLMELGELYFQAFLFEKAAEYYGRALEIDPGNLNVRTSLGICLIQLDRRKEALDIFEGSVAMNPDHWQSWLNLGIAALNLSHDLEKAEKAFAEVERIHPDLPELEQLRRELARFKTPTEEGP